MWHLLSDGASLLVVRFIFHDGLFPAEGNRKNRGGRGRNVITDLTAMLAHCKNNNNIDDNKLINKNKKYSQVLWSVLP